MISKNQKRFIVIVIAFIVSWYIWTVNERWGNTFYTCLILSTTTFLIIFTPFEIYFAFRDIWFDRWESLYLTDLNITKEKIEVNDGFLLADLIKSKDSERIKSKNAIIIISHGFSDTKETLQYYNYPLAYQGYIVLAYDARGTGESKKTGKRGQFLKRIDDFEIIINWIKSHEEFSELKIFCIGFSIGATTVLCGGFPKEDIKKIIAISSMSNFRQNVAQGGLFLKVIYSLKGVNMRPKDEINRKLSPFFIMETVKNDLTEAEWKEFSQKVLLIHARNDKVIKFKNYQQNTLLLDSPIENQLVLRKGGHTQKKNELALVGATLKFLN